VDRLGFGPLAVRGSSACAGVGASTPCPTRRHGSSRLASDPDEIGRKRQWTPLGADRAPTPCRWRVVEPVQYRPHYRAEGYSLYPRPQHAIFPFQLLGALSCALSHAPARAWSSRDADRNGFAILRRRDRALLGLPT